MARKYVVKLTMDEAKRLGIVVCAHCGWPRNNHFDFGAKKCAHDNSCPGWRIKFRVGKSIR